MFISGCTLQCILYLNCSTHRGLLRWSLRITFLTMMLTSLMWCLLRMQTSHSPFKHLIYCIGYHTVLWHRVSNNSHLDQSDNMSSIMYQTNVLSLPLNCSPIMQSIFSIDPENFQYEQKILIYSAISTLQVGIWCIRVTFSRSFVKGLSLYLTFFNVWPCDFCVVSIIMLIFLYSLLDLKFYWYLFFSIFNFL